MDDASTKRCPDCGSRCSADQTRCLCGCIFDRTPKNPPPPSKQWIAYVPAVIVLTLVTCLVIYAGSQFTRVAGTFTTGSSNSPQEAQCLETYAVTLHTSEFYVREFAPFAAQRPANAPRELSTVIRGTARNTCTEKLRSARLSFEVRDEKGARGSGTVSLGAMEAGQTLPFEKAWMGRVTDYTIVSK